MTGAADNPKLDVTRATPVRPAGVLFRLTFSELLGTRRVWLFVAVLLLPVVFSLASALSGKIITEPDQFWGIVFVAYFNVVIPFSALLFGATLIGAERESDTLVYLLTRPVSRPLIVLVKYAGAGIVCVGGIWLSMAAAYLSLAAHYGLGTLWSGFEIWARLAAVGAVGVVVYLALFLLAGMVLRRPVVLGVIFIVLWEGLVGLINGVIRYVTIIHYVRSLGIHATEDVAREKMFTIPAFFAVDAVSASAAFEVLAALTVAFLALAVWHFSRAEFPTRSDR